MLFYSNLDLFKGIQDQNPKIIKYLYKKLFPIVLGMVSKYKGSYDEANDVFQEAIVIFYRRVKDKELNSSVKVQQYIVSTCRQIWFRFYGNQLREEEDSILYMLSEEDYSLPNDEEMRRIYRQNMRRELFYRHFEMLGDDCKRVLKAFFIGKSYDTIAKENGFSSETFARRKKYLCKEYLVKSIKSDPEFDKIIGDYDD